MQERRRFKRIKFDAQTEIVDDEHIWPVHLLDLSFKGSLVEVDEPVPIEPGTQVTLKIHLAANDILMELPSTLMHQEGKQLGFHTNNISIESISHLRRLVELNLGDETLLERELEHLMDEK